MIVPELSFQREDWNMADVVPEVDPDHEATVCGCLTALRATLGMGKAARGRAGLSENRRRIGRMAERTRRSVGPAMRQLLFRVQPSMRRVVTVRSMPGAGWRNNSSSTSSGIVARRGGRPQIAAGGSVGGVAHRLIQPVGDALVGFRAGTARGVTVAHNVLPAATLDWAR